MPWLWDWLRETFSSKQPEGTEGVATVTFSNANTTVVGFIVRNNAQLTRLIDPRQSYWDKYRQTKYFVYVPNVSQREPCDVATIIIVDSSQSSGKELLSCELDKLETEKKIAQVGDHHFIPCESVDFNKNSFLRKHSKIVLDVKDPTTSGVHFEEKKAFYGLIKGNDDKITLTLIQVRRSEHNNNSLVVEDKVFDELTDCPILLENKTILAGCLQKNEQTSKITIHCFGMEDAIDVWKASIFHQSALESGDSTTSSNQETTPQSTLGNNLVTDIKQRDSSDSSDDNRDVSNEDLDIGRGHANQANILDKNDVVDDADDDGTGSVNDDSTECNGIDNSDDPQTAAVKNDADVGACQSEGHNDDDNNSECSAIDNIDDPFKIAAVEDDSDDVASQAEGDSFVGETTRGHDGGSSSSGNYDGVFRGRGDCSNEAGAAGCDGGRYDNNDDNEQEKPSNNYQDPAESGNIAYERSISTDVGAPIEEQDFDASTNSQWGRSTAQRLKNVTFCKLYEHDSSVVQDLGKIFDKKSSTLKNVTSLADKVEAHPLIKDKCNSNYHHSPASELLDLPYVSRQPIQELVKILRESQKEQLASKIETKVKSQEKEKDKGKTIEDFFLMNFELKEEVTVKLEGSDSFNWRWVGNRFGVDAHVLDQIERGTNAAERFLVEYAYCALPKQKLQLYQFLAHMSSLGRSDEILNLFDRFGITQDEYSKSMKIVFKPNTDRMEELCKLLNKNNCKGWQHLAVLWDVDELTYFYYIPNTKASATRILFDWLMMQRPDFTVFRLCEIFRDMERYDAYEVLTNKLAQYSTTRTI